MSENLSKKKLEALKEAIKAFAVKYNNGYIESEDFYYESNGIMCNLEFSSGGINIYFDHQHYRLVPIVDEDSTVPNTLLPDIDTDFSWYQEMILIFTLANISFAYYTDEDQESSSYYDETDDDEDEE